MPNTAADFPCPDYCTRGPGHHLDVDTFGEARRVHVGTVTEWGVSVELRQFEAVFPDGRVQREDVRPFMVDAATSVLVGA